MIDTYVTAITSLLEEGRDPDLVLKNVREVMAARGHESLYGNVLKAVLTALEATESKAKARVTVTKESDANSNAVKKSLAALGVNEEDFLIEIDPTIIGGHTVVYKDRLIDQSFKTALKDLYQSITASSAD